MAVLLYYELLYYRCSHLVCIFFDVELNSWKFLLHVVHRVVSCLFESLLFCSSPFFGFWFTEFSLFRWSRILWSELMCETSPFIKFFIITKEHITSHCSWYWKFFQHILVFPRCKYRQVWFFDHVVRLLEQ